MITSKLTPGEIRNYLGKRIYIRNWGLAQIVAFHSSRFVFAILLDFHVNYKNRNTYGVFTISEKDISRALKTPESIKLHHDSP